MTYYQTKFSLTKNQLQKIASAVQENSEVTLRLSKANFNQQGYNLPLTHTQINKLNDGNVHDLKFSSAQMKYINNKIKKHPDVKNCGFLPLAALIPIVATVLGGLGSVAGTVASTVQKSQANSEIERHNRELENQLKSGTGYDKLVKHYNKLAGKGHSKDEIINSLQNKFGSGVVSDFLSKIPILGNILSPITNMIGLGLKVSKKKTAKGLYLKSGKGLRL
jgi:hypothetical protein